MRVARSTLCLVLSSLVLMNLLVFVMFQPKGWKISRLYEAPPRLHLYAEKNITFIAYEGASSNLSSPTDCRSPRGLSRDAIRVNVTSAQAYYWSASNLPNTIRENSTFLGFPRRENGSLVGEMWVFEPRNCKNVYNVAIIVPFRDRESHLRMLLGHLIPILRKQLLRYSILVMEQVGDKTFNKGRLMNTGFEFASEISRRSDMHFDCFIFQDVDLLAEHESLLHRCSGGNTVMHLSAAINKFDYKPLCCGMTVGGVLAFNEDQFRKVNGYPNSYWGWGGEDDDIHKRLRYKKIRIVRPKQPLGRYTMIKHDRDKGNPYNNNVHKNVLLALRRMNRDGLSSLDTKIVDVENYALFTKVLVDVGTPV